MMNKKISILGSTGSIGKTLLDIIQNDKKNLLNISKLKNIGLQFESDTKTNISDIFNEKTFVVSGIFQNYTRDELKNLIEINGGKNLSSVSTKTNYLLAGDKMGPSKLQKANELGIEIISEQDFDKLLKFKS